MGWIATLRAETRMVREYDPSVTSNAQVLLTYSGLHGVWCYRLTHRLWQRGHRLAAQIICQVGRVLTGVEIHPGAVVGSRLLIDHGTGIVVGQTAEIGNDVVLYHGVTLGGRKNSPGKRHPTVGNGVFVGANASVLGPVQIGDGARIGAGAIVLQDVPAGQTVVGNPARIVVRTHPE